MKEQLLELRLEELHGFRNHPFQAKDDEAMDALCAFCGAERPLVRYSTATRRWQRPGRNQSVEAGFMTTV